MVNSYMLAAIGLCQDDYLEEIEATIPYVKHKLRIHGVTYWVWPPAPKGIRKGGGDENKADCSL